MAFYTSIDLTESIGYGVDLVVNVAFHDMEWGWGFVNETTKINDQNPGLVVGAGFTPYGEALTRGSLIYREHYTEGEHGPPPASVSDALTLWFQVSLLNDHAILSFLWLNRLTPCHPRRRGNQRNHGCVGERCRGGTITALCTVFSVNMGVAVQSLIGTVFDHEPGVLVV